MQFPETLKDLKSMAMAKQMEDHPNVPKYALNPPKFNPRTSNGLTKCIIQAINLSGGHSERTGNMGRTIDNRQTVTDVIGRTKTIGQVKWIPGSGTNGTADISAIFQGIIIKVEVKIGKDRLSPAQERYRDQVEASGGIYIVAKEFESFIEELKNKLGAAQQSRGAPKPIKDYQSNDR